MDRRTKARELAMQALFQLDAQGKDALAIIENFFIEHSEDELIRKQAKEWALGTWGELERCDTLIQSIASGWKLPRISAVERNILRLCTFQFLECPEIPRKVVINEGIEMAKKFCSKQSPGFVNGVLDAIKKKCEETAKDSDT